MSHKMLLILMFGDESLPRIFFSQVVSYKKVARSLLAFEMKINNPDD
jgi:hypothetical protein